MGVFETYIKKRDSEIDSTGDRFIDLEQINDYLVGLDSRVRELSPINKFELDYLWRGFSRDWYSAGFIAVNAETLAEFVEWLSGNKWGL